MASSNPSDGSEATAEQAVGARVRARARIRAAIALGLILLLGAALRAWIVLTPGIGHEQDLQLFARWTRAISELGLTRFYAGESFCDYPPLMILAMGGAGWLASALGIALQDSEQAYMVVKTLACFGDLAAAAALTVAAARLLPLSAAVVSAGLYFLNPVTVYDSAYWGQFDSIYTALLVACVLLVGEKRWWWVGGLAGLGLLAKFQAIAILPVVLLEAFRTAGLRGMARILGGATIVAIAVLAPFAFSGTMIEALDRSYVRVVGQYNELSKNAYNVWQFASDPSASDVTPPAALVRAVAAGRESVSLDESAWLRLSWRVLSLIVFAIAVAVVLSLFLVRPSHLNRYLAAGLLALCFFLFPTEMHERYAYPAIALLAVWAASSPSAERVYWILTILLTLNLAAVLPAEPLAPQIAAGVLLAFTVLLGSMLRTPNNSDAADSPQPVKGRNEMMPSIIGSPIFRLFQFGTALAVAALAGGFAWLAIESRTFTPPVNPPGVIRLSSLNPDSSRQGWKSLARAQSVSGGVMRSGPTFFLDGIGTHAPAQLEYSIPSNATHFAATVGIDAAARDGGSSVLRVLVDGDEVAQTPRFTGAGGPIDVRVPIAGGKKLMLVLDATADGRRGDHVNLGLARFETEANVAASQSGPMR